MTRARGFALLAAGLLLVMAGVQILSVRNESQTWDEALTLAAGYSALRTGDLRLIPEHPALGKYLNALPLLALKPGLPLGHESWAKGDGVRFGDEFLYRNGAVPAGRLLFWGRMASVLITMLLGASVAWWSSRRFGHTAALFALVLFSFDPNVLAHGRYATSDIVVTLFWFLSCVCWGEYLLTGGRRWLVAAGVTMGLALTSKFSALLLLPVFALLGFWRLRSGFGFRRLIRGFTVALSIAAVVVIAVYAPEAPRLIPGGIGDPSAPSLRSVVDQSTFIGVSIAWTAARLGLRAHSFPLGISLQAAHNRVGHSAYLWGARSETGWWYFFPVAFALKSPLATLTALALALVLTAMRSSRGLGFEWCVLAIPASLYLLASMTAHINIGLRHLLPVYPLMAVFVGATVAGSNWRSRRLAMIVLSVGLIVESAAVYPHYLAFFNVLSGGPEYGPRYLVDSNIDWGQDVPGLKSYLDSLGNPEVCVAYFGRADLDYYGIAHRRLPTSDEVRGGAKPNCWAAISVTLLYGAYGPPDEYAWLRSYAPLRKIGYSIYVYDLRHP